MTLWKKALERSIPNPGVPGLKPRGGSKVDSAFHPSDVDQMSTGNSSSPSGKEWTACSGSLTLR